MPPPTSLGFLFLPLLPASHVYQGLEMDPIGIVLARPQSSKWAEYVADQEAWAAQVWAGLQGSILGQGCALDSVASTVFH